MRFPAFVSAVLSAASTIGCSGSLDMFILRPTKVMRTTPADFGFDSKTVNLPTEDGHITIWHVPTAAARKGILVIVPGNDANKSRYTSGLPIFVDDGWDVILMDYEGFGESTGTASFEGLIESTNVVMDYAFAQDDVVVGLGVSLGTPVLVRVAADYDFTACIFESTINLWEEVTLFSERNLFASPLSAAADGFTTLSTPFDYNTKHWITLVEEPKLFLHSPDDSVTPLRGAWEIFELAPQPKHMFMTQGEHALQVFIDPVLYRSVLNGWLDGVLGNDPVLTAQFQAFFDAEVEAALGELGLGAE